ncbi:pentatricopeptide repeat-containing protein [Tripterygium wilfordii]|uniref:Pentatricopeptide repeat-containing protein n=1 Tax=Tripterygium wilfordii TaxID=458696 RepID=A0A7J7C578_TRIWF|nr:pentatricopeptide repeat-containing protein At3g13160, mitochondrial-like [Tripterygium wilfordii]KAF5728987.1 pentatricopeptide repeat-containing protein [Tripterygium wilfordii]
MSLSRVFNPSAATKTTTTTTTTTTTVPKDVFSSIYKERNLKRLVEKFKKSSEFYRFRRKNGIYENTVHRLASAGRFKWIEEILEDQKRYEDMSKEGFGARLISLYGKAGMFENAHKVFSEMPERNCKQTVLSFNALLGACVNSKKFDKVDGLFKDLPDELSVEPDLVSYNTVIKAFCEMGSLESGISMVQEMEKKGIKPDLITFNTLLYGSYGSGRFEEGERIWALLKEKNLVPDVRSYNARLVGLALEKRVKEAVEVFEEMRTKDVEPDVFSFNALIKGFAAVENLEEAKRWYGEIEKNDCKQNKESFAILVPFLCDNGDFDFAFKVCKDIFHRKKVVGETLLQNVVDGLVKESKIEEAEKIALLGKTNSYNRYRLKLPSKEE